MTPNGSPNNPRVIDFDEEMPDYDTMLKAQDTYEELLEELEKYSMAKIQGSEVEDELELVRDDIRQTRAYLKVEIQSLEPTDFFVGGDPDEYREKAEKIFEPKLEFLEERFQNAENYRKELTDRL